MAGQGNPKVEFRTTPVMRQRIERLARDHNTTLSGALKIAVMQATKGTGVPSETEVLELLGEAARDGSVSAMKEMRAYWREQRNDDTDKLAGYDEVAAKRSA